MEKIFTENAPAAIGPYSQAMKAGNQVYTSGQIPIDPKTGVLFFRNTNSYYVKATAASGASDMIYVRARPAYSDFTATETMMLQPGDYRYIDITSCVSASTS